MGAGIAGLAAAVELISRGMSVVVVESRDRVGGRLLSANSGEASLDLGATWFWPGEDRVARLVARLGVNVHGQYLDGDALFHTPAGAQRIDGNPLDGPSFRFSDGADSLTTGLAALMPAGTLHLNTQVDAVAVGVTIGGSVGVEVQAGELRFEAQHVVLALPPALAVHSIHFEPSLPDRLAGLARVTPVWMGGTTKVVARFQHPFWREEGLSGSAMSHVGPMRELHDMCGPDGSHAAIFGFVPASGGGPTITEAEVCQQLRELFGPQCEPIDVIICDWRTESATSPPGAENLTAYQTYGHELFQTPALDGRVHWASTETSQENPGHIEGALAAAERAVDAIASSVATASPVVPPHAPLAESPTEREPS